MRIIIVCTVQEISSESISTASPSKPKAKQRKLKAKSDPIDGLPLPSPSPSSSRSKSHAKVTLRVALPKELEPFPCCLCVSRSTDDLLPVHDDVTHMWPLPPHLAIPKDHEGRLIWKAHESCAMIVAETWVDKIERENGKEKVVKTWRGGSGGVFEECFARLKEGTVVAVLNPKVLRPFQVSLT